MCPDTSHFPEEELLEKMQRGDHRAFEKIYHHYSQGLHASAYNLFRDKQLCEDLVQELFANLWIKRNSLKIDSLKPYLYRSIRNSVLMAIRSGKARPAFPAIKELVRHYAPDAALAEKDIDRILNDSVNQLPEKCRRIFQLSRKEFLSNREIALRLNLSVKTVENQITIALRRLRISLRDFLCWSCIFLFPYFF